ncbi:MAG TPA: type I methionyl aminopeptidase [Elusimicrobiota bacterium]|nr:type I methionyl aminopeptidase [Elusimicrobiota bacterium]
MTATKTIEMKSPAEIGIMREAGRIVADILVILSKAASAGTSTAELDRIARKELAARKVQPAFLGYRGFPAALCVSINSEVVHGIPSDKRRLAEGDLVSLDFGAVVRGFYADAAVTVGVGRISARAQELVRATEDSLARGVAAFQAGARLGDISSAVQKRAESAGFSVVRDFVGHGIGRALHEDPAVPNYGASGTGPRLSTGMVLAIEPMINAGDPEVEVLQDGWTAVTKDGALSAHFEHTVALTEHGSEILTAHA